MMVFTKKASEEVVIDKPSRVIVLETAPDKVKVGLLPGQDRHTVRIIAPYGEEIEIDC